MDGDAVRFLLTSERVRRMLMLKHVIDSCRQEPALLGPLGDVAPAQQLLMAVDAGVLEVLLLDPHVGMWLVDAVQAVTAADPGRWRDVGAVMLLGAAAGVRAAVPFEMLVPVRHGQVILPGLGRVELHGGAGDAAFARLQAGERSLAVHDAGPAVGVGFPLNDDRPGWSALRVVDTAGPGGERLQVRVDDLDPVPVRMGLPAPVRLDDADFERWRSRLTSAWQLLARDHPREASAMAVGLKALIPLPGGDGPTAGSSAEGFGAAAMALPATDVDLACALLHEFMHSVLNGLLHLVTLTGPDPDGAVHYAPWRDDPRPLSGMLHGAYAFTAVTGFWAVRCDVDEGWAARRAELEFATWRLQTANVLTGLTPSPRLEPLGRQMIQLLHDRSAEWSGREVAPDAARLAELASASHRAAWRVHHVQADPGWVDETVGAWLSGSPAPPAPDRQDVVVADPSAHGLNRLFLAARTFYAAPPLEGHGEGGPDQFLLSGRADQACERYLFELAADPFDVRPWVGLGPAVADLPREARPRGADLLIERPERVRAVHLALLASIDAPPDVLSLAAWLAGDQSARG